MATPIHLKHSAQAGRVPDAGVLANGELAINTKDVKAYIKNADGQVVQLAGAEDGRYVQIDGDSTAQTITGSGGLKTEGLLETGNGFKMSGGYAEFDNAVGFRTTANPDLAIGAVGKCIFAANDDQYGISVQKNSTTAGMWLGSDGANEFRISYPLGHAGFRLGETGAAFVVGNTTDEDIVIEADGQTWYNNSVYIGGSKARNTFELWKSTLTEEQLEQLEVGTLVAPANVSTPGDGSFARSWYYDQQDAETQALLDSGELEYPKHFQAANFVDTFDLGDNTNINLLSNGSATFAGDVQIGEFDGNDYSKEGSKIFNSGQFRVVRQWDGNPSNDPRVFSAFLGPDNSNQTIDIRGSGSARFAGDVQSTSWDGRAGAAGYSINPAGAIVINGVADEYALRIYTENTNNVSPTIDFNSDGSAEFAGDVKVGSDYTAVSDLYNNDDTTKYGSWVDQRGVLVAARVNDSCLLLNQKGDSPSAYLARFQGKGVDVINFGNDGSATFAGDITAGNVVFNLETDNPDNYITTTEEYTETEYYTVEVPVVERPGVGTADIQDSVSTADLVDGDERETQTITKSREVTKTREIRTYTGPTLDVKEELQSLRARATQQDEVIAMLTEAVEALKAAPASDFESRIASLEVDMARFKAI